MFTKWHHVAIHVFVKLEIYNVAACRLLGFNKKRMLGFWGQKRRFGDGLEVLKLRKMIWVGFLTFPVTKSFETLPSRLVWFVRVLSRAPDHQNPTNTIQKSMFCFFFFAFICGKFRHWFISMFDYAIKGTGCTRKKYPFGKKMFISSEYQPLNKSFCYHIHFKSILQELSGQPNRFNNENWEVIKILSVSYKVLEWWKCYTERINISLIISSAADV